MKNKNVEQLEQIKFEHIEMILQILGCIESKGKTFHKKSSKVTRQEIESYLDLLALPAKKSNAKRKKENDTPDRRRQIANALSIFNRLSKSFLINGDKSGTYIKNRRTGSIAKEDLKADNAYQTLIVIYLSLLLYQDIVSLDFLSQFLELEHPLNFLTLIQHSIRRKNPISFEYRSDRNDRNLKVDPFLPVKIYFKDNHWYLVGWDFSYKDWNQYLLHSIKNISLTSSTVDVSKLKEFNLAAYRKNAFGASILNNQPIHTIEIEVPVTHYNALRKRRKEGKWDKTSEPYIWTVETFDPNEVFDYIFRWNGILKIKSPEAIKKRFQDKLKSFS